MGYTTIFEGKFILDRELTKDHAAYLTRFSKVRHMKRDPKKLEKCKDPFREAVGLPIGEDGCYFVGSLEPCGQDYNHPSVVNTNEPPKGQPEVWCSWEPTDNNKCIAWNEVEKFYSYIAWLEYLIEHFLKPWGYILNGKVRWIGEDSENDQGLIYVLNNKIATFDLAEFIKDKIAYLSFEDCIPFPATKLQSK